MILLPLSSSSTWCFIATAAHGDPEAPEVRVLRRWRDECLAGNFAGRQVVKAYYALSPRMAVTVSTSEVARGITRAALAPIVGAVRIWMEAPWLYGLAVVALGWRLLRRRR